MFLSVSAFPRARKPVFEFVGSLKTPFMQFVDSLKLPAGNIFDSTKKKNKCRTNSKSLFLPSASLASNRSDEIMISEVLVRNKDGEELERKDLENEATTALKFCRPNSTLSVRQVEEDVHRITGIGYFSSCRPVTVNTGDSVRLVFQVEPNQEFRGLVCEGGNVLPSKFVENSFRDGYGEIVNLRRLEQVISSINDWYMDRGLFGVVSGVKILSGGIIKLQVSEAEVNDISIRFHSSSGEPTKGTTRPETILRELTTKKGQVYSMLQGKRDAETVLGMGIMKHVSIVPQPAGDTDKVDLTVNVVERESVDQRLGGTSRGNAGGLLAGLIGSFSIFCRNLFGRNQKVDISLEKGRVDSTFRINYKDPWIEGDDKRTWRSIMVENSKTPGTENQLDGNSLTIGRSTASIEYGRPFWPKWSGTAGVTFQRVGACDDKGNPIVRDFYDNPLTASGNTNDNMLLAKLESVYTGSGSSTLVLTMEQALPVWKEWLAFNRVAARARKGLVLGPTYFSFSLSGGHMVGNFPPYEAVPIGGTNSVRGYENGAIGSGPSHAVGSAEVSFPLLRPVEGVLIAGELFADYGTDLGSGSRVPGDPAGTGLKARSGYGYGAGVRVETPFGPLWLHYAFNDQGTGRFHSGVGHRN